MLKLSTKLSKIYQVLYRTYGPQNWWPADSQFEIIVGAILTQSTAWVNVEKAINNLKAAEAMSFNRIYSISLNHLRELIRPSGYYNSKADKLKAFVNYVSDHYGGDLNRFIGKPLELLRPELITIYGIGNETADDIILYASNQPSFVIDEYTRRIILRIGLKPEIKKYHDYKDLFESNIRKDTSLYNEYHALLVEHGKRVCKSAPICASCCLRNMCSYPDRSRK